MGVVDLPTGSSVTAFWRQRLAWFVPRLIGRPESLLKADPTDDDRACVAELLLLGSDPDLAHPIHYELDLLRREMTGAAATDAGRRGYETRLRAARDGTWVLTCTARRPLTLAFLAAGRVEMRRVAAEFGGRLVRRTVTPVFRRT